MSPTDCLGVGWAELTDRLDGCGALARWGRREPELASLSGLAELAAVVHDGPDLDRTDRVFGALLRTAAADDGGDDGGDVDAALVVAHLLAHGTRSLALGLRDLSSDIDALIAGALWVQIRTFRWQTRRRGFAKGVLLDTRTAVLAELAPQRTAAGRRTVLLLPPQEAGDLAERSAADGGAGRLPADPEWELADLLSWAQGSGVLSADDVALLVDLQVCGGPEHRRVIASAAGVHERTLRRRCNRATGVLRGARLAYLEQAG